MFNFLLQLWFWLLVCVVIGASTGILVRGAPPRGGVARWLIWTGLAFIAGALAAALGVLQGAPALFLESALACYAAFLFGAAGGARGSGAALRAHEGWALGLIPAALVWWGATLFAAPTYQAEVQRRVEALAAAAGADAAGLSVSGHDVSAPPSIAENGALMAQIAAAPGVRRVIAVSPPQTAAAPPAPAPLGESEISGEISSVPEPAQTEAPSATSQSSQAALAQLPEGPLDAAACQAALDAVVALNGVEFPLASATITRRTAMALDKAVEFIRRCPRVTIEVRGRPEAVEAERDRAVSRRRAQAVARYLRREGVGGRRIVAGEVPRDKSGAEAHRRAVDFSVK